MGDSVTHVDTTVGHPPPTTIRAALAHLLVSPEWWGMLAGVVLCTQWCNCLDRNETRADVLACIERGHGPVQCRYALADDIALPSLPPLPPEES